MTDKAFIERQKAFHARRVAEHALRTARIMPPKPRIEQVRPFTLNQLDTFRLRSEARRDAQLVNAIAVFGKKKKLPLPTTGVFACENTDCGEAGHAEGRCGNAACIKQLRPRVMP